MPYRNCGHSGLKLPVLSLGLWQNFGASRDYASAMEILGHAFDAGITHSTAMRRADTIASLTSRPISSVSRLTSSSLPPLPMLWLPKKLPGLSLSLWWRRVTPLASGLVESLARPGGNVTGLSQILQELGGKRLGLLKEMVPKLSSVAVLWNPQSASATLNWKENQQPARQLGIQHHSLEVRSPNELDKAFEAATRARAGALAILPDPVMTTNLKRIADFAAKNRLPSIYQWSEFADAGGLVTYGPDRADLFRRAATYVDKILKGTKPGDLPVEQPTKLELVMNLKTAKTLGITIPQSILVRADRVIE